MVSKNWIGIVFPLLPTIYIIVWNISYVVYKLRNLNAKHKYNFLTYGIHRWHKILLFTLLIIVIYILIILLLSVI